MSLLPSRRGRWSVVDHRPPTGTPKGAKPMTPEPSITWGLWIAAHLFFVGISVGVFFLSTLPYVFGVKRYEPVGRILLFTALMVLLPVLLFVALHSSSTMTEVVWPYGVYTLILLGQLWLLMRERTVGRDRQIVRMLGVIGVIVALSLRTGPGTIPGLFPMTFLVLTLLSGGAFVVCLSSILIEDEGPRETMMGLARLTGALLGFELLVLVSEILVTLKGGIPSQTGVLRIILVGSSAWIFWVLQIGVGALVPLLLLFGRPRVTLKTSAIACFFILVGALAFLLNGIVPQLEVHRPSPPGLAGWALLFFAVGLSGLTLLAGSKFLPLVSKAPPK